jgi:hypothetical protein
MSDIQTKEDEIKNTSKSQPIKEESKLPNLS